MYCNGLLTSMALAPPTRPFKQQPRSRLCRAAGRAPWKGGGGYAKRAATGVGQIYGFAGPLASPPFRGEAATRSESATGVNT